MIGFKDSSLHARPTSGHVFKLQREQSGIPGPGLYPTGQQPPKGRGMSSRHRERWRYAFPHHPARGLPGPIRAVLPPGLSQALHSSQAPASSEPGFCLPSYPPPGLDKSLPPPHLSPNQTWVFFGPPSTPSSHTSLQHPSSGSWRSPAGLPHPNSGRLPLPAQPPRSHVLPCWRSALGGTLRRLGA